MRGLSRTRRRFLGPVLVAALVIPLATVMVLAAPQESTTYKADVTVWGQAGDDLLQATEALEMEELEERQESYKWLPIEEPQEWQGSYNQQYLDLKQGDEENRQYTVISNIMKTKGDTTKDSISNVR